MYLRLILIGFLSFTLFPSHSYSQKIKEKKTLKISYYNLNNLYDTLSNSNFADSNFTPNGKYKWDLEKYNSKIGNLATVISSLHDSSGIDLIGVSEVENEQVVNDLISTPELIKKKYKFVFSKGENSDGLGTAILYNPKKVKYLWDTSFSVNGVLKPWDKPIADVMNAKFLVKKEIFNVIVVNFPNPYELSLSAYNSQMTIALSKLSFYLQKHNLKEEKNTLIMGTFGIEPTNQKFILQLNTSHPDSLSFKYQKFVPLALFSEHETGTFYFERSPFHFDHVLIPKELYSSSQGWQFLKNSYKIYSPDWMLHPEKVKMGHPYDNFFDDKWIGGYSNHFPISFKLVYAKKRKTVN